MYGIRDYKQQKDNQNIIKANLVDMGGTAKDFEKNDPIYMKK